ncbi:MAG: hypothetical protein ACRDRW_04370 [Pseudonocardiaceae bacterium]
MFSIDTDKNFTIGFVGRLTLGLGTVSFGVDGVVKNLATSRPLPPQPADVTQLFICKKGSARRRCEAYEIGTGRKINVELDGHILGSFERNRIVLDAAPGSTVRLTDNGPLAKQEAFGPAHVDVEEFHFSETGKETFVNLENSSSGTDTDLSYDHRTGELKPIRGAKVSTYATYYWTEAQREK